MAELRARIDDLTQARLARGKQPQDRMPVLTELEDELHEVPDLHSEAERRLYVALTQAGVATRLKPVVEGYELDFALDTPVGPVNIEVDGIHTPTPVAASAARTWRAT